MGFVLFRQKCINSFNRLQDNLTLQITNSKIYKTNNLCWVIGFVLLVISLLIRTRLYVGTDPAFYYLTAERILHGQKYYYDFFETNFPLSFYIFTIPVIFHNITGIAAIPSFYIFVTSLSLISIYCSSLILKGTSIYKDLLLYQFIIIGMFIGFFFPVYTFALNEIGTKTLLFLAFIAPYFCSFFWEADNKKLPLNLSIMIGIFAGLAVCLKPNYVLFPLGMELYVLIKNRNLRYIFRPINYVIILVNIIHLAWLVFFIPEYIFKIFPMAIFAYHGFSQHFLLRFFEIILGSQWMLIFILFGGYRALPKTKYREVFFASIASASVIVGSESLWSPDQLAVLYFFDGILIINLFLDILRHKPIFQFYEKIFLSIGFTAVFIVVIINFCSAFNNSKNVEPLNSIIKIIKKESNGEIATVFSDILLSPLVMELENENFPYKTYKAYNKSTSLEFIEGTRKTKERYIEMPNSIPYKIADFSEKYFINAEIEEVTKYHPKLLFISTKFSKTFYVCYMNYLEEFMQNEEFKKAFSEYELYDRIVFKNSILAANGEDHVAIDMSVYIRREPGSPKKPPLKFQGIFF